MESIKEQRKTPIGLQWSSSKPLKSQERSSYPSQREKLMMLVGFPFTDNGNVAVYNYKGEKLTLKIERA
jgi:hypothetical protein